MENYEINVYYLIITSKKADFKYKNLNPTLDTL
jgi:hypothetical protein